MSAAAESYKARAPAAPHGRGAPAPETGAARAVPLATFLDQVADVLRAGLPDRVWLAATVVEARASAAGHTLELSDPASRDRGTLRVFLATGSLASIRCALGVAVDPALLVGMTMTIEIVPAFTRRWHLGGRVEAIGPDAAASVRARLLDRLVAMLKRERLWDRQRVLPRPRDVTRLAVIHPAGAAGWGDIAGELGRWKRAGIVVVRSHPTPFEGGTAAGAIAAALRAAVAPVAGHPPDLVLVVRGGGAKASLVALDEEIVARAILACPVPVVTGTGHAQDCSVADRVAWRSVDTPSKAVALVGNLIRAPARAAATDRDLIRARVTTLLLAEVGRLQALRHAGLAGFTREHGDADRRLAECWSQVRSEIRGTFERLLACRHDLDRHRDLVLRGVPQRLDALDQALRSLLQTGLGRAAALLGSSDDGGVLIAQGEARAAALLERETAALQRHGDAMERATLVLLERSAMALDRDLATADAVDPDRMLARGFVLVTDGTGSLLTTHAAASQSARLQLRFGDGVMAVVPVAE